jgi:hypothetical protein
MKIIFTRYLRSWWFLFWTLSNHNQCPQDRKML